MKSIITGISGQDGAYLAQLLVDKGYDVIGLIRNENPHTILNLSFLGVIDKVRLIKVDLEDQEQVSRIINSEKPNEVYHLAAVSSVGYSFNHPFETLRFNFNSTLNIIEAVRLGSPQTSLFNAVSSESYGNIQGDQLPINENMPFAPESPYGVSKVSSYYLIKNFRKVYGLRFVNGILFNHESVLRKSNFVTKKILSSAVRASCGEKVQLSLGNLSVFRDWGYVPDFVWGMWKSLQCEILGDFVFATGHSTELRMFLIKAFDVLNLDYKNFSSVSKDLYRENEILKNCGDPSKAKELLGWSCSLGFDDLVQRLVEDEIRFQEFQKRMALK